MWGFWDFKKDRRHLGTFGAEVYGLGNGWSFVGVSEMAGSSE